MSLNLIKTAVGLYDLSNITISYMLLNYRKLLLTFLSRTRSDEKYFSGLKASSDCVCTWVKLISLMMETNEKVPLHTGHVECPEDCRWIHAWITILRTMIKSLFLFLYNWEKICYEQFNCWMTFRNSWNGLNISRIILKRK